MFTLTLVLSVISILVYLFYKWATKYSHHFDNQKITALKPVFLMGNNMDVILKKKSPTTSLLELYNKFPRDKIIGMFDMRKPAYFVRDPEMIKLLGVKKFDHFIDHRIISADPTDPIFGRSLFAMKGHAWKEMRATLSPAFTGSKMRLMFDLVSNCGNDMTKYLSTELNNEKTKQIIELKDLFSRFANDIIATCAFGIEINSLKNPKNEFFSIGERVTNFKSGLVTLKFLGIMFVPWLMKILGITFINKTYSSFFQTIITDTIQVREKENIVRQDMINLLMNAKKGQLKQLEHKENLKQSDKEVEGFATVEEHDIGKSSMNQLTNDDIGAQCFLFFFAGFDTVSTAMTFIAYELAINPDVQKKLHIEVENTNMELQGQKLTYDALQKMNYLDMVTSEALRKWPPVPVLDRMCVKDYNLKDGDDLNVHFKIDDILWFPAYPIHHDPKYYPNPEKFDPERFSDENKHNINPLAYLPFGVGPRNCIGSRLALMETKAIIYYILLNFTLEKCEKTQVPLILNNTFGLVPNEGVYLKFQPRKQSENNN